MSTPATDLLGLPALVQPFRPRSNGWVQWPVDTSDWPTRPYVIERWYNRGHEVQVMSALERVQPEGPEEARLEYHLSVSGVKYLGRPYRCSDSRARWALKQFGFEGYTEDNHVPHGIVRNYWRPIADRLQGQECPCIDEEPLVREMKGDYRWRGAPEK